MTPEEAVSSGPSAVRPYLAADGDAGALREAALRAGAAAVLHELHAVQRGRAGHSTDTPLIEVRLHTHPVIARRGHAYLCLISDGHPAFEDDPRFANLLPDGRRFATLGAGPKNMQPFFSTLVSDVNRAWDTTDLLPDTYDAGIQHPHVLAGTATEREVVERLFAADAAYGDATDYDAVPFRWSDGYNSNSYIAGLLAATGWDVAKPPRVPGWTKPLPPEAFGVAGSVSPP